MNNNNVTMQGPVSVKAQILSVLGSFVLIAIITFLVRKGYLKSGYSILWFFVSVLILILSLFTEVLFWFSQLTGIYYAPAAIFSVLFIGIILIAIHFSIIISKHEKHIKKLTQENALIRNELEVLKKSNKKTKN